MDDTKTKGVDFIEKELDREQEVTQSKVKTMMDKINSGERDVYF